MRLQVWLCPECGEIQLRRGVSARCAGSETEGTAHEDRSMIVTTVEVVEPKPFPMITRSGTSALGGGQ
jgi:hypothetical protein